MNAYELADRLDANVWGGVHPDIAKCTNMLRQQADRIVELEKRPAIDKENGLVCAKCYGLLTPQTKPLSDEEIIKIFNQIWVAGGNTNGVMHRFARAIEAKVREGGNNV